MPSKDTFYFLHQIKLQTLPYVQKQIAQFIDHYSHHFNLEHQAANQFQKNQWRQRTAIIYSIMTKKLQQIQHFHYLNWMDYRANLVFRSKKLLTQFYQNHQHIFASLATTNVPSNLAKEPLSKNLPGRSQIIDQLLQERQKSAENETSNLQHIKESVKKIKTQMLEKTSKSNLPLKNYKNSTKQSKKTTNGTTANISKQQISNEISKIIEKVNVNEKPKTSLVFASRRAKEEKVDNIKNQKSSNLQNHSNLLSAKNLSNSKLHELQSRQKYVISQRFEGSLQKNINRSIQKAIFSINKSKQKSVSKKLAKKNDANGAKKTTKEEEKSKKGKMATKNMTKEEYIQYLINKNKMSISATKF